MMLAYRPPRLLISKAAMPWKSMRKYEMANQSPFTAFITAAGTSVSEPSSARLKMPVLIGDFKDLYIQLKTWPTVRSKPPPNQIHSGVPTHAMDAATHQPSSSTIK